MDVQDFIAALPGRSAPPRRVRAKAPRKSKAKPAVPVVEVSSLPNARYQFRFHDGDKFPGGFGTTRILETDYWTLRWRSAQLFKTNLYARGIVRRMVTNEINQGLNLEATPEERILGMAKGALDDWTEEVETRFSLWARDPRVCDAKERLTFGEIQNVARREALVVGDVLVSLQQDPRTRLPRVRLISGAAVQTPVGIKPRAGHRIVHGVELDPQGRQVAYWVRQSEQVVTLQDAQKFKRLPACGPRTGRRLTWLVYGSDKRMDEVRGEPILSLVLQSLREIDRYRDALQRKAIINAMVALFIKKSDDGAGTRPFAAGAVRKDTETVLDETGEERTLRLQEHIPGLVFDELQTGEEPVAFQSQTANEKLGEVEEALIQGVAWALEIPPEILRLSFSSNYSASQAAINEYKIYLNPVRTFFGAQFCQPVYEDWFIGAQLQSRFEARGFLQIWRDPSRFEERGAWLSTDWSGHIKPSVKMTDVVKAYTAMVAEGFITRERATRELNGTKFSHNIKRLRIENQQVAEARQPLQALEPQAEPDGGENEDPDVDPDEDEDDDE